MCYSPSFFGGNVGLPSETVAFCLCVCTCRNVQLYVWASHLLCRQFSFLFHSLVQLMNNDLIVDCGVKCQLSVFMWHVILTGVDYFTASPFVSVMAFTCCQCSSSPQQELLRKLIDHFHFSRCAADMHSIWPNYSCFHCNDGLDMCIFIFFKCPLHCEGDHFPCPSPNICSFYVSLINYHSNLRVLWWTAKSWLGSILWTSWLLITVQYIEGQPDGRCLPTSCSHHPSQDPLSSLQWRRSSLWCQQNTTGSFLQLLT